MPIEWYWTIQLPLRFSVAPIVVRQLTENITLSEGIIGGAYHSAWDVVQFEEYPPANQEAPIFEVMVFSDYVGAYVIGVPKTLFISDQNVIKRRRFYFKG